LYSILFYYVLPCGVIHHDDDDDDDDNDDDGDDGHSGNLPQCYVLIELLYCGLIKFFFF